MFLFVVGLIIAVKEVVEDNDANKEAGLEAKGVEDQLACGVISIAGLVLLVLISLITGIPFLTEKNIVFICIPILVPSSWIGSKLSKNYDRDDNYNGYFYVIGALLGCILLGLAIFMHRKFYS